MAHSLQTDVAAQARSALSRSRIYSLRHVDVDQEGDALVLRGDVESYYHKQLAQELVRGNVDGAEVVNAISVVYGHDAGDSAWDW